MDNNNPDLVDNHNYKSASCAGGRCRLSASLSGSTCGDDLPSAMPEGIMSKLFGTMDPPKQPLSRFDLILLRTFQAQPPHASGGPSASICSACSSTVSSSSAPTSRQDSLISSDLFVGCTDSAQLQPACSSSSTCSSSSVSMSIGDELQLQSQSAEILQHFYCQPEEPAACSGSTTIEEEEEEEENAGSDEKEDEEEDGRKKSRASSSATVDGKTTQSLQHTPATAGAVAASASCSSSSGVSSSPGGASANAATAGAGASARLVRRHSAFQLPHRLHAVAASALGKFASPPPPGATRATTVQGVTQNTRHTPVKHSVSSMQLINNNNGGNAKAGVISIADSRELGASCGSPTADAQHSMRQLLEARENGMELGFERCKAWSKYASQLVAIVRQRLAAEQEHAQKLARQAEQAKAQLQAACCSNTAGPMPLTHVLDQWADCSQQHAVRAEHALGTLQQRVVAALENRQKEHDARRRKLKTEWAKQRKQLDVCAEELRRARQTHMAKGEQYLRAKEVTLRQEHQIAQQPTTTCSNGNGGTANAGNIMQASFISNNGSVNGINGKDAHALMRKRCKEVEKRRRAEEEALTRKSDAENDVKRLECELDERRQRLRELRHRTVNELADLVRQCELTTIAATSTLLKALADLWQPVPGQYLRLADATRSSQPGAEFMSYLHSLPPAAQTSNVRAVDDIDLPAQTPARRALRLSDSSHTAAARGSASASMASASSGVCTAPSTAHASPLRVQRRNALTDAEQLQQQQAQALQLQGGGKRRGKAAQMTARLFDTQSSSSQSAPMLQLSEAARSHQLVRTRQVTRCAQCEHLLIFDAVKCKCCGLICHKKCLAAVQLWCGESAKRRLTEELATRRMSIFGVPLAELRAQHARAVPLILERCVDELQRRGMRCKGLYRTCGVKSKVEQICTQFEQAPPAHAEVDLSDVHPMNIASVVKLYLRRLPEPLMTHHLYGEWLALEASGTHAADALRAMVARLPELHAETLKFLMLHLNRVTWFEADNLMSASNLAAVIAPSLLWPASYAPASGDAHSSAINDAHRQSKAVEALIRHAHDVFGINLQQDWRAFFDLAYPDVPEPVQASDERTCSVQVPHAAEEEVASDEELDEEEEEDELLEEDDEEEEEEELLIGRGLPQTAAQSAAQSAAQQSTTANGHLLLASGGKKPMESSSSDLDCGSSAASTMFRRRQQQLPQPNSAPASARRLPPPSASSGAPAPAGTRPKVGSSLPAAPGTAPQLRRVQPNGKQQLAARAYTTSILVSPMLQRGTPATSSSGTPWTSPTVSSSPTVADHQKTRLTRFGAMHKHRSMDEGGGASPSNLHNNNGTLQLQSGEVTVQLNKDHNFAMAANIEEQRKKQRSLCLQSMLNNETSDVSYV